MRGIAGEPHPHRTVQVLLGATVLVVNLIAYALVFARTAASRPS
jgi:hypothetical protein